MYKIIFSILLIIFFIILITTTLKGDEEIKFRSNINYINKNEICNKFLKTDYKFNKFDLKLRNIKSDIHNFYCSNIIELNSYDKNKLNYIIYYLKKIINKKFYFLLKDIHFVKWNNNVDMGYPQTHLNLICLPEYFINNITINSIDKDILVTIIHECIHIWQRKDKKFFDKLYKLWNFKKVNFIHNYDKLKEIIRFNPDGVKDILIFNNILITCIYNNNCQNIGDVSYVGYELKTHKNQYTIENLNNYNSLKNINEFTNFFGKLNYNHYDPNELSATFLTKFILENYDYTPINIHSPAYIKMKTLLRLQETFKNPTNLEPHLAENDKKLLYKYLDNTNVYFEYGSGGSTYQASIRKNIKKIYSVESDSTWQKKLKEIITNPNINYIYNEMDACPNNWGYPGKNATNIQKINYSNHIRKLSKGQQDSIDLVFIDGRFRVACCLKCYDIIKDTCLIAFDDFLDRPEYHIVLEYFDIIEKTQDNRLVIIKKKNNVNIPKELIEKYELIEG